jgi:hypothetical protein
MILVPPITRCRGDGGKNLLDNTSGGVAEDALVEDGQDTAASTLANGRAGRGELVGGCENLGGLAAVEVGKSENIGSTALGGAVEARAGSVDLALVNHAGGSGSEAGDGSENNGEGLHFE